MYLRIVGLFVAILTLALTACSSGGNSGSRGGALRFIPGNLQIPYTIGGTVSGLAGSGLVLQNNAGDNLSVGTNGSFSFGAAMNSGETYSVTVLTQPTSPLQTCTVTDGSGSVGGNNVTNVQVTCVTVYRIGGTVSGLAGSGLVLQNNAGDNLSVGTNGSFSFGAAMNSGETYSVTVLTQPTSPLQTCTVTDGSGTVAGSDVTSVQVACIILGDINGDGVVNHIDALLAQRIALGMITATPEQIMRGDIYPDGKIDVSDYLLIQKMGLGL